MPVLSYLRLKWTLWSKTHKCFYLWGINYRSKDTIMLSKEIKSLKCGKWLLLNWAIVSDNMCAFSFSSQLWTETHSSRYKIQWDIALTATGKICVHCKSPCTFYIEMLRFRNITRIGPAIGLLQGGLLQFSPFCLTESWKPTISNVSS